MMNADSKSHGLTGSLEEPDWPPLTMPEVRALLSRFPRCGEPLQILKVSPRPFSSACLARTSAANIFVKRHHRAVRDVEGLLEEHGFMRHLRANEARVPLVLRDDAGCSAIRMGEWMYEVHEAATGVDLYGEALSWTPFETAAHARSAGVAMAQMHLAAEGYSAPRRNPRPLVASFTIFAADNPGASLHRYLAERPALAQRIDVRKLAEEAIDLLAPFHAELLPLTPALRPLWTHNDLHASNLFWSSANNDASVSAVIDFGLADLTSAVHDLAHAIERNIVEWLVLVEDQSLPERVPVHLDHLEALLEGYESVRRLSDEEAASLAPMVALCHAEFALSEADYFLGVLQSEGKAGMAYDGWLVGHARWFRSEAGTRLLHHLREWALRRAPLGSRA
jgi:Ser/Thr protein kinase RdoA (MazF antagonist)